MFDSQRIKRLRESLQLSETQFAKRIGVSQSTYNRVEKGTASLPAEALSEIVKIFNVDPSWLLLGIGGVDPVFASNQSDKDTITISKDEFIALQRKALQQEEAKVKKLEQQVSQLKND